MGGSFNQTISQTGPLPAFLPGELELRANAQAASKQVSGQPFGGGDPARFLAPVNPLQEQGLQQRQDLAQSGQFSNIGQPSIDLAQATLRGDFLSPDSNPFLQGAIDAASRPITDDFVRRVLPMLQGQSINAGAFDNRNRGNVEVNLASQTEQNILDVTNKVAFQNYINERNLQQQAPALLEAGVGFQQLESQILSDVGAARRAFTQEGIEAEMRAFEESNIAPFRPLFPLATIFAGQDLGQASTITSSGNQGPTSGALGLTSVLGAAGLAAGAGAAFQPQSLGETINTP